MAVAIPAQDREVVPATYRRDVDFHDVDFHGVTSARHNGRLPARQSRHRPVGGYVVCSGPMRPGGGIDRGICVARSAHTRAVVVARVWEPDERSYFISTIEPLLHADAVFVGDLPSERRMGLLARADALVNPASSPSAPIMAEALACGTPILTLDDGPSSEIVETGRTGFVCVDEDDMVGKLAGVVSRPSSRTAAPSGSYGDPTPPGALQFPVPRTSGRDKWRRAGICAP